MATLDSAQSRRAGLCAGAIVAILFFGWVSIRFGLNTPPATSGDEPSYDSLAWEMSHGRGYSIDYANEEFRQPYDLAAIDAPELFALPRTTYGPAAYRPPLIPAITAIGNFCFGRQHYFLRSLNILAMAATAGMITWYLSRYAGAGTAILMTTLFLADVRSRLYARAILTESIACLLGTILALLLLQSCRKADLKYILAAGVTAGLSVLARSIVILWLPGLALLIFFVSLRIHKQHWLTALKTSAVCLACATTVIAPWAVRNVTLLERFAPMGTQGLMELSAGYSDTAWRNHGVWTNLHSAVFFEDSQSSALTGIQQELRIADVSRSRAFEWIYSHPEKLPLLALMKVCTEFCPADPASTIIMALCVVAMTTCWRNRDTQILLAFVLVNATAISLTWSVEGRFVVPQLFSLYALAGQGTAGLWRWISPRPQSAPESPSAA